MNIESLKYSHQTKEINSTQKGVKIQLRFKIMIFIKILQETLDTL